MTNQKVSKPAKKSALPPARWGLIAIVILVILGFFMGWQGGSL